MSDSSGSYDYTYDARSQMATATSPGNREISYRWNSRGQKEVMTAPNSGTTTFAYNSVGQLESVQNARDERTTFSYDLAGQQTLRELANGTRASQTFDSAGQLQQLHNLKSDDTVIAGFEYGYDAGGNRTHVLESNGDRVTWGYDAANQLTSEDRSGANAYAHSFGYDPVGNRLTKTEDGATTTSSYDAANQIESSVDGSGTTNYTFDDNGNQHLVVTPAGDRTTWTWDYENQAVKVDPPTGTAEEMTYNADSRRVTLVGDSTQNFLWDTTSDNVVEEADENDSPIAIYTDGPDLYGSVISQERGNDIHFYHFNGQGSTVALTDDSELITDTAAYTAFGELLASTGSTVNPWGYKGGLGYYSGGADGIYVRARYLQPSLGRWLSMDPLGFVDGVNMFGYSGRSPIVRSDPSGFLSHKLLADKTCVGNCNHFRFPTEWLLSEDESNGFVVQQVCFKIRMQECGATEYSFCDVPETQCKNTVDFFEYKKARRGTVRICYVEVWRVKDHKIFVENPYTNPTKEDPKDWFASLPCNDPCGSGARRGNWEALGLAWFFPMDKVRELIPEMQRTLPPPPRGVKPACDLASGTGPDAQATLTKLRGLLPGAKQKAQAKKKAAVTYDCCDCDCPKPPLKYEFSADGNEVEAGACNGGKR